MPKVDLETIVPKLGSDYPSPFERPLAGREARSISDGLGLKDFHANHVLLPPGCWSSQRHWHEGEDELVVVLAGSAVLIDDNGRQHLHVGDVAVFPKGDGNGHHLVNEGIEPTIIVAVSLPERSPAHYPDIDLLWSPEGGDQHKDGTPYGNPASP
jgi:uncharacterized cupin superfamily protein